MDTVSPPYHVSTPESINLTHLARTHHTREITENCPRQLARLAAAAWSYDPRGECQRLVLMPLAQCNRLRVNICHALYLWKCGLICHTIADRPSFAVILKIVNKKAFRAR